MRTLTVTLIVAAALAAAPAAARADTLALSVSLDPVEDIGFTVTATGDGQPGAMLYATIEPARRAGCPASYPGVTPRNDIVIEENAEGAYTLTGTASEGRPGRYQLCGWLQPSSDATAAYARTRELVDLRSARASARISGPRRVRPGRAAHFRVAGSSELPRWLEVDLEDAGHPCDAAPKLGSAPILLDRLQAGDYQLTAVAPHGRIIRPGRYRLCAWVMEGAFDPRPEAAAGYAFRVTSRR